AVGHGAVAARCRADQVPDNLAIGRATGDARLHADAVEARAAEHVAIGAREPADSQLAARVHPDRHAAERGTGQVDARDQAADLVARDHVIGAAEQDDGLAEAAHGESAHGQRRGRGGGRGYVEYIHQRAGRRRYHHAKRRVRSVWTNVLTRAEAGRVRARTGL